METASASSRTRPADFEQIVDTRGDVQALKFSTAVEGPFEAATADDHRPVVTSLHVSQVAATATDTSAQVNRDGALAVLESWQGEINKIPRRFPIPTHPRASGHLERHRRPPDPICAHGRGFRCCPTGRRRSGRGERRCYRWRRRGSLIGRDGRAASSACFCVRHGSTGARGVASSRRWGGVRAGSCAGRCTPTHGRSPDSPVRVERSVCTFLKRGAFVGE